MKEIFQRFGIRIDDKLAREHFVNRVKNSLSDFRGNPVHKMFIDELGLEFSKNAGHATSAFFSASNFEYFLAVTQVYLNLTYRFERGAYQRTVVAVKGAIAKSPIDLGIRLKESTTECAQILPSGSEYLDEGLVDDVLGVLKGPGKEQLKTAFDRSLYEMLHAGDDQTKFHNAAHHAQVALDELAKYLLGKTEVGFAHLFREDGTEYWKQVGLNDYQKQVFKDLNNYLDKCSKHHSGHEFTKEDIEAAIYMVSVIIRLTVLKKEK